VLNIRYKVLIIILCTCITIAGYLNVQNNWIQVERFDIKLRNLPQAFDGFKIVHVSDVHLPKNASNVQRIVKLVQKQVPDIIVLTGDVIDESAHIQTCGLVELCQGLTDICDVYAVTGNHEFLNGNMAEWEKVLEQNDVMLIDNQYVIIETNNQKLVIMGLVRIWF